VRRGALGGWHDDESERTRHGALRRVARRDGAGEVSRRLNFVSNVANRQDNTRLERVAREDQRWVAANLEDEDRRRGRSKPIRVRRSRRARGHRRRRAR
jgi:hypothetical protein